MCARSRAERVVGAGGAAMRAKVAEKAAVRCGLVEEVAARRKRKRGARRRRWKRGEEVVIRPHLLRCRAQEESVAKRAGDEGTALIRVGAPA